MCKYGNQQTIEIPNNVILRYNAPGRKRKKIVCIDPCLVDEIKYLWSMGIRTTGHCCGHNDPDLKEHSYIGVEEEDIPHMKKLGYKKRINPYDEKREDEFIPKT